jgi:hypothetical protein
MTTEQNPQGGADFKDRKAWLVVFGVLEILLGALCALMIPLMLVGMAASAALGKGSAASVSARSMVPGLLFYVALAAWFITMGIGSIMARRWARALLLVSSWLWLLSGVLGLVFLIAFMPSMFAKMGAQGQLPPLAVAIVKGVTIGFMVVFYIIVPGVLVLFYGSRHTRMTCETRDAKLRWTDKCPLPVLALSLMAGLGAVSIPLMGVYGWIVPLFGTILTGGFGAAIALVSAILLGYVAWGAYGLDVKAWWCAVLLVIVWGASTAITFSRVSVMELYEKMDLPSQQLEAMKQAMLPQASWMVLFCVLWAAVALGYLLFTHRYFRAPAAVHPGSQT